MNTVEMLMQRNHLKHEIDGVPYVCHRWTTALAVEAFGPGVLMMVAEAGGKPAEEQDKVTKGVDAVRKVLEVAMISPRLGDQDDAASDTVSYRTLGDHAIKLYSLIVSEDGQRIGNFPESSEGQGEA